MLESQQHPIFFPALSLVETFEQKCLEGRNAAHPHITLQWISYVIILREKEN